MGLDLAHGGHLTHGSPVNMSGIWYNAIAYQVKEETGMVDYDDMERKALEFKPKMIIGGASAYSREWDWERMRAIADRIGAIFMVDMAHPAGLIAAGLLKNPEICSHCHIYDPQNPERSSWRYYPNRQRFRESFRNKNSKRGDKDDVCCS